MFDSENNSLVTRIEASTGVLVTYATNSEGENIYKVGIDSDYIASLVTANAGGTLTLNATDEARIAAIEEKLGIQATTPEPAPSVPTGQTGTTEVNCTVNGSETANTAATVQIKLTYSLVGIDGTTLISENMIASAGAAANIFELGMYSQMSRNNGMLQYMTPGYVDGKLVITWKEAQRGSTFKVDITQKDAGDDIVFTVTNY